MTAIRQPTLSESPVVANARADVAWWESLLERLKTVPGAWSEDWDPGLAGPDAQERAIEECAEALRQAKERLAELEAADR